jgi:chromosome segregation ATPase
MRTLALVLVLAAAISVAGRGDTLNAQASQTSAPLVDAAAGDAIAALTTELRALRTELVQTTRANTRMQLLVSRLQLHEQRIMHLDRERSAAAAKVAESEQARAMMAGAIMTPVAQGGVFVGGARQGGPAFGPDEREAMQRGMEHMKAQLETMDASIERWRAQEAELVAALSAEQGRWNDVSARLDELERELDAR